MHTFIIQLSLCNLGVKIDYPITMIGHNLIKIAKVNNYRLQQSIASEEKYAVMTFAFINIFKFMFSFVLCSIHDEINT